MARTPAEIALSHGSDVRDVRRIITEQGIKPSVRVGLAEGYDANAERQIREALELRRHAATGGQR